MDLRFENSDAFIEGVSVKDLADNFGTPTFCYSQAKIESQIDSFQRAFESHPTLICYAVKANSNLSLLKLLAKRGLGADIVSAGELKKARLAEFPASQIVFSGVGKQEFEMAEAMDAGILAFHAESIFELEALSRISKEKGHTTLVSLRVNPNIAVKTNPYIATGLYQTKFGIAEDQLPAALRVIKSSSHLKLVGLSSHLGSLIGDIEPYAKAGRRLRDLADKFKKQGFGIEYLDLGGGFPVSYDGKKVPPLTKYADAILASLKDSPYRLLLEPGRAIVAESGWLLTKVIGIKTTPKKNFLVVDAAMTELIRPSLYSAFHPITLCHKRKGKLQKFDVVGPVCETGDFLGLKRPFRAPKAGDLLVVGCAGAYGSSMSSHYNLRPKAAEVLVHGDKALLVRKRESIDSLWQDELS